MLKVERQPKAASPMGIAFSQRQQRVGCGRSSDLTVGRHLSVEVTTH